MDEDLIFSVSEHEYKAGKLDAKRQFHIVRRLAPLFGEMAANGVDLRKLDDSDESISGFLKALGLLPDDVFDYVVDHCLSVVKRRESDIWSPISVAAPNGKRLIQYQDIEYSLAICGTIVYYVFQRNLRGFFKGVPQEFKEHFRGIIPDMFQ
jgi:hypothetical protein